MGRLCKSPSCVPVYLVKALELGDFSVKFYFRAALPIQTMVANHTGISSKIGASNQHLFYVRSVVAFEVHRKNKIIF